MRNDESEQTWLDELHEILAVLSGRSSAPDGLPHCAICARYATDALPFDALLSLIDAMPPGLHDPALAVARGQLASLPPAVRKLHVCRATLPALMDSPGWSLVRSLVIDLADQDVCQHFGDPRLCDIEEITLLGFAYGGCEMTPEFARALYHSPAFVNVRALTFHSVERDETTSRLFWASPMVRRLERISGAPYFGEHVESPLAAREIGLSAFVKLPDGFSLRPLLDPRVTPHLTSFDLRAYGDAARSLIRLLADENYIAARVERISLGYIGGEDGEISRLLRDAVLPASVRAISWESHYRRGSVIRLRGGCDLHPLYDFADPDIDIRLGDKATGYGSLVFDWRFRDAISRRVEELCLLLPLDLGVNDLVAFCGDLPGLRRLSLVYPFAVVDIEILLAAEPIRRLDSLSLLMNVNGGQWEGGPGGRPNEYMAANAAGYRSTASDADLFGLAFDGRSAFLHELTIATASFELTRSPDRIDACAIRTTEAVRAFASCGVLLPVEELCLDGDMTLDEATATALVASGHLGRTYRLDLRCKLDDGAARVLAGCEQLRSVRAFDHWCSLNSHQAIRDIVHSPHLTGVWDVNLSLPDEHRSPGSAALIADSPMLDRAVILGSYNPRLTPLLPASGRLGRLRVVNEMLSMHVFGDARGATEWLRHPLGLPFRARLADFVRNTYAVARPRAELPHLATELAAVDPYAEKEFVTALRVLLATAFRGESVSDVRRFAELGEDGQRALRAIALIEEDRWYLGNTMSSVLASYGFSFRSREELEKYIGNAAADAPESSPASPNNR